MLTILTDILNLCIFLAGLIGLLRWRYIDKAFYPFVILIWCGCVNEVLSILLARAGYHTIVNNNIYILLEALLVVRFFKNTGLFQDQKNMSFLLSGAFCAFWLLESLFIRKFAHMNTFFFIVYAFSIVLMSISTINHLLVHYNGNLLLNAVFLICLGFVVYFTQSVLVNSFWLYGLTKSKSFLLGIHRIMIFTNLFANLTYAAALICIPKKQPSLLPG